MIIDCHVHTFPAVRGKRLDREEVTSEKYGMVRRAGRGLERMAPPSFEHMTLDIDMLLAYMDWIGVNKAVLFQAPIYGNHNEYYAEIISTYSDKFVGYALIDPRTGQRAIGELHHAVGELGLTGVKIEIPDMPFDLADRDFGTFWEELQKQDAHLAIDLGWEPEDKHYFQLEALRSLLKRYPDLKLHLTHTGLGGRDLRTLDRKILQDILSLSNICRNILFDLSALPLCCPDEEYPFPSAQRVIREIYETVGAERMIWGSDIPSVLLKCTYSQCLTLITKECNFMTPEEKQLILGENARRFYDFRD